MGVGIRSLLMDFEVNVGVRVKTDTNAAKGIANRKGLGKVRHVEVNQLWVQDRVARGDLRIEKGKGKDNIAAALTKHVTAEDVRVHLHKSGHMITEGRA